MEQQFQVIKHAAFPNEYPTPEQQWASVTLRNEVRFRDLRTSSPLFRLSLISEEVVNYNDLAPPPASTSPDVASTKGETNPAATQSDRVRGDPNDPAFRLKRDCVGVLAAFRRKGEEGPLFVVACTHLYW